MKEGAAREQELLKLVQQAADKANPKLDEIMEKTLEQYRLTTQELPQQLIAPLGLALYEIQHASFNLGAATATEMVLQIIETGDYSDDD